MSEADIALVCWLDDFAQFVEQWEPHHLLPSGRHPIRDGKLCLAQMLSILVLFHVWADKDCNHFRHDGSHKSIGSAWAHSPVMVGL